MKWKSMVLVALLAVALMGPTPRVAAQTLDPDTEAEQFDSAKFWDYTLCGVSIVFATGTGGWMFAAIACGKAFTEHWTR